MTGPSAYHEEQRFGRSWVWGVVLLVALVGWWAFVQQIVLGRPFGDNPGPDWGVWLVWFFIGLGLPALFFFLRLVVEVTADAVVISYRPLLKRSIPLTEITRVEARRYNAIKEYGGWGIKGWSRKSVAYNVSGSQGVELTLRDGRRVMLGSQRAEELAQAIEAQRHA